MNAAISAHTRPHDPISSQITADADTKTSRKAKA
jgi:hypothetical protein